MATWPSRLDLKLSDKAISEVSLFVENAAHLEKLINISSKQKPQFRFDDIIEPISKESGLSQSRVRNIFNSLENFKDLEEDLGSTNLALLRLSQAVDEDLKSKIEAATSDIVSASAAYGRNNPVTVTIKAQRLAYLRENLLNDAEILTDARPVFNNSGSELSQFIITHTLALSVIVNGDLERRFLSLDNADIFHLRSACDRAIVKARTLKASLGATWPVEIVRDEASDD